MTEKKPGEPKCYQYGPNPMVCAVHGHYVGCTVWREEIESRARRAGAREALEIAGKEIGSVLIRLINSNFSPEDLRRALADQPEAEVCHICGKPATCIGAYEDPEAKDQPACDECCGHGNEDGHCRPIMVPGKADALKRGDEFGWTTISGVPHYGTVTDIDSNVVYVRCRYHGKEECCEATQEQLTVHQPEAAHGRK